LGLRLCDDRRSKRCSTGKRARTPEQIAAWKRFGCEDRIVVTAARALRVVGIGGVAAGEACHGTSSGTGRAAPSVQKSRTWSNTIVCLSFFFYSIFFNDFVRSAFRPGRALSAA
jgi:hypothetical protein